MRLYEPRPRTCSVSWGCFSVRQSCGGFGPSWGEPAEPHRAGGGQGRAGHGGSRHYGIITKLLSALNLRGLTTGHFSSSLIFPVFSKLSAMSMITFIQKTHLFMKAVLSWSQPAQSRLSVSGRIFGCRGGRAGNGRHGGWRVIEMCLGSPGPGASRGGRWGAAGVGCRAWALNVSRGGLLFLQLPPGTGPEATRLPLSAPGACPDLLQGPRGARAAGVCTPQRRGSAGVWPLRGDQVGGGLQGDTQEKEALSPAGPSPSSEGVRVHTWSCLGQWHCGIQTDDPPCAPRGSCGGCIGGVSPCRPVWASREPETSSSCRTPLLRKLIHFPQSPRRFPEDEMKIFAFISGKCRRANVVQ